MASAKLDTNVSSTQTVDLPLVVTPALCRGRTFIVTGANTGLGYEAARHLVANHAARVVMAVRNVEAGEKARTELLSSAALQAAGSQTALEVWPLDLASYASVQAFAARARAELDRLDVVIQNAGVAAAGSQAEGHPLCLTVNVLGTVLLGVLLLPQMSETASRYYDDDDDAATASGGGAARPHLSFVSSGAGFQLEAAWEKIKEQPVAGLNGMGDNLAVYPLSKIVLTQTVRFLAQQIAPVGRTGVVVNALCPGLCVTELDRHAPPEFRARLAADREDHGRTAEQGSRTLLHGALAGVQSHGRYLDGCEIADEKLPPWLRSDDGQKCWDGVRGELEKISPGCVQAVLDL
ncbi:hypothetical protein Micbo1qcDRAFT_189796 [Microdochium bolleyi]|uniref:Uncharacterized protein n=1 Tax=Microdochium bolleyi TaxID=196109 RepID=A0A136IUG4_9PEZI|nr:hypothetical protein Micbo1qcDRAFT_189796 [Microdochium bolleyi]